MSERAFGIIDVQRGFMPASEGERLGVPGFGELPVDGGEQVIAPLNRLIGAFAAAGSDIFTTQDWHPRDTAHFSGTPDFITTWPVHCMGGSDGALLHPDLQLPASARRFLKGREVLISGEDDTSYSGYYSNDELSGESLPSWIARSGITEVVLGGLALDYCVGKTALDLRQKLGVEVSVAIDAMRGISPAGSESMVRDFEKTGVKVTTSDQLLFELSVQREEVR